MISRILIGVFKANSSMKSTKKSNIHDAYRFKALMLEEWELRSHTIIPFILKLEGYRYGDKEANFLE